MMNVKGTEMEEVYGSVRIGRDYTYYDCEGNEMEEVYGSVRIGRSGSKLHPAVIRDNKLWILCSCPGTQQGGAYKNARFLPSVQANCKNNFITTTKDV